MAASVEFHTGVAEPLGYACRLLRKAQRSGARVLVLAPPAVLAQLDQALWTFDAQSFVPHLRVAPDASPALARTPIWLAESERAAAGVDADPPDVVVALQCDPAPDADRHVRIIEVVGDDDAARAAGRARWRHYEQLGIRPSHRSVAARPEDPERNQV